MNDFLILRGFYMKTINMLMMSGALAVGALVSGCQTTTTMTEVDTGAHGTVTTYQITDAALQANNWQLVDAKTTEGKKVDALFADAAKPLTLTFANVEGNNMVRLMNTCNNISAPYTLVNGDVKIGNMISTMMACPDAEAKFDAASVASVVGKYTLSQGADKTPMLVVTNDHQVAHFKAVAKAEAK